MGDMRGMLFFMTVLLISLMLFGLIVGTLCLNHAGNTSEYVRSTTTYWVYAAIAFAIGIIMLLVLLYLAYMWSCMCAKPVCEKKMPACPPKRASRCGPSSCY